MSSTGTAQSPIRASVLDRIGRASNAGVHTPRGLGKQVEAESDRYPDDGLGRHRGHRVRARRVV